MTGGARPAQSRVISLRQPPGTTVLLSVNLLILRSSYKWNYTVFVLSLLAYFTEHMSSGFIRVAACVRTSFGCCKIAMSMGVQVTAGVPAFSSGGNIPRHGIAGSFVISLFNFLRNQQTVFQHSCTILRSHQQRTRVSISLHPHHFSFFFFFEYSHSSGCAVGISLWF